MQRDPEATAEVRRVAIGPDRELCVRYAVPDDADGLQALYDGLDLEDRYRRFFQVHLPRREFFERMTTVQDRGGLELVAVVTEGDGVVEIVGEAGYTMLRNGDGELAMAVADRWRGWLGPYLLDALLSEAAARHVPNLEADVLVVNRPMLATARARGCVTMASPDLSEVRLLVGTTSPTPTWPPAHMRPRVLVEGAGGPWHLDAARAEGLDVVVCPGPSGRRVACPALGGMPCSLAAGADVIVVRHPDDAQPWADLLAAHRRHHAGVPVCIEAAGDARVGGTPVVPSGDDDTLVAYVRRLARA